MSYLKKNDNVKIQKPFLKWVGGKTQIIKEIISKIPKEMNNYHEFFLGGGTVLLAILSLQKQNKISIKNKIYAYDINESLIRLYKDIQNHKEEFFELVHFLRKEYDGIVGTVVLRKPISLEEAKTSKESYYYWIRSQYNQYSKNNVKRSAMFLFLNKTCFRGMYRESVNGFNVPYGHYKKTPQIITKNELDCIHELIQNVEFKTCHFIESFTNLQNGDFLYLDPPYAPENAKSFVGYVQDGFDLKTHLLLFEEIKKLNDGVRFLMSNAKVDLVTDNFKEYDTEDILVRRSIHCKKPQTTTMEILIFKI